MYRVIEKKKGAYGWYEFDDHEPFWNWRDAVEVAKNLAEYRSAARRRKWSESIIEVRCDSGEVVFSIVS